MKNLLKNVVGAVAPTLGTALGGPMGGMAANMIADVLGCPNNPKAIEKAVAEATPEQMLDFAALGISQAKILYDIENPSVGLLSNGSESNKGNKLVKEKFILFQL